MSPAPAERRTQVERRSEAETALLDAAMRLFARHGVESTSLAAIGDEAGYSRGLANHHFGSRAALVERLARRGQRRFVRGLDHADITQPDISPTDAVIAVADAYLSLFDAPSDEVRAFFIMRALAIPHEAPLREVYAVDDRRFRSGVAKIVEAGQADGTITSAVDAGAFSAMVVGMVRGVGSQCLIDPDGVDLAAVRAQTRALVESTLTPPSP